MALLTILNFPDPRLRTVAKPVALIDNQVRAMVADLFETMYEAKGIGLAATQVNIHQRIITIDVSQAHNQPLCLINPEIISTGGEESMEEGCLSVPGFNETVTRYEWVTIRALDQQGHAFELNADGLLAVCIQHEIDHLNGKLFVDYLSPLKRNRIRSKLEKSRKHSKDD